MLKTSAKAAASALPRDGDAPPVAPPMRFVWKSPFWQSEIENVEERQRLQALAMKQMQDSDDRR